MSHIPVMMQEVLQFLDPKSNQNFVDCTLGDAGHALAVLERTAPKGKLLGIDADAEAVASVELGIRNYESGDRLVAVQGNFRDLGALMKEHKFETVQGILLDLGFSSSTLERGRGFSFEKDEILDMRFDSSSGNRAAEIVNGWDQRQLAKLLQEYGEEHLAVQIANKIVYTRKIAPIVTTKQLAEVVIEAYREKLGISERTTPSPSSERRGNKSISSPARGEARRGGRIPWIGGIHPATRTFQALRIAVNDELSALQEVLPQAVELLVSGGRLAVISFHSLEDRIVKHYFKGLDKDAVKLLTKKPIYAGSEEINNNPKARSAKLRVIEKI